MQGPANTDLHPSIPQGTYRITLGGEAWEAPLPTEPKAARGCLNNHVVNLAAQHQTDGHCVAHRGLSILRINVRDSFILDYRIRVQCLPTGADGEWTTISGRASCVDREATQDRLSDLLVKVAVATVDAHAGATREAAAVA